MGEKVVIREYVIILVIVVGYWGLIFSENFGVLCGIWFSYVFCF